MTRKFVHSVRMNVLFCKEILFRIFYKINLRNRSGKTVFCSLSAIGWVLGRVENCTHILFVQLFGLPKAFFVSLNVCLLLKKSLRARKSQCLFFTRIYLFSLRILPENRKKS